MLAPGSMVTVALANCLADAATLEAVSVDLDWGAVFLGHSLAKWPTSPQYTQAPSPIHCCRLVSVSLPWSLRQPSCFMWVWQACWLMAWPLARLSARSCESQFHFWLCLEVCW